MRTEESFDVNGICQIESFSKVCRFKLVGYSLIQYVPTEIHLQIGTFDLAGHSWAIIFFPNGDYSSSYIAIQGKLLTGTTTLMFVDYEFSLLDQNNKPSSSKRFKKIITKMGDKFGGYDFMKKKDFESSKYLKDDCFIVQCTVRVLKPTYVDPTKKQLVVPPSNLNQHFEKLLESKEEADITFEVNEARFFAHKNVLAVRSPVFMAQFFGSMIESASNLVKIEDVKPEVFKLMLHFVYTDMLPHDEETEISSEMAQHLFVVADRYGLERLKLICSEILCDNLSVGSAATTLVLAEQHNCKPLKDFCVDFVSSREALAGVMASEGFSHLMKSCPFILKELLDKLDRNRKF